MQPTNLNDYYAPNRYRADQSDIVKFGAFSLISLAASLTIQLKPDFNLNSIGRIAATSGFIFCGFKIIQVQKRLDAQAKYKEMIESAAVDKVGQRLGQEMAVQTFIDEADCQRYLPQQVQPQPQPQYQQMQPQPEYEEQERYYQEETNNNDPMGIIEALDSLGVSAEWKGAIAGASFVRALVKLKSNPVNKKLQKISVIQSLAEDLAALLNLDRTPLISRDKGNLAIDIPRSERTLINFSDLIKFNPQPQKKLLIAVGVDLNGKLIEADLSDSDSCHFLVGGTTGSGKTEFIKVIIASIIWRYTPEKAQLVIIDPKRTKFNDFANCPSLYCPIVKEVEGAIEIFEKLVNEMESRYQTFENSGCENIEGYWKLGKEMPRIIVVCDEFADFMGDKKDKAAIEKSCKRLGQKAREAGIHLILATQRPEQSVVTPILRSNLPGRIALKVKSDGDSNIILGEGANAHLLLGKGDLLFQTAGGEIRLQAPLLNDFSPLKAYKVEGRQSVKKPCSQATVIDVEVQEVVGTDKSEKLAVPESSKILRYDSIPITVNTLDDAIALVATKLQNPDSPPLAEGRSREQIQLIFKALLYHKQGKVNSIKYLWGITKSGTSAKYKQAEELYSVLLAECSGNEVSNFLSQLTTITFPELRLLPASAGVYFVFDSDYQLYYIGSSNNILFRWNSPKYGKHHRYDQVEAIAQGKTVKIGWILTSDYERIEADLVAKFKPKWNGC